ncbi:unnamed protein product [Taenia asiatica]|uniref:SP-RING-type domain-containing protein n=1 Tax=Taenia asiatica TaxID=60517 RepID=A0A0R3VVF0_TAEAS|nr:unnamed protein product [Taenia asiatica]
MEGLLLTYVQDENTELLLDDKEFAMEPLATTSTWDAAKRIRFAEFQRPRSLLAFFVDIYRVCVELTASCRNSSEYSQQPEKCLVFFHGYSHLLATYTQIVCKYLTAVEHYDVDYICPNLCIARAKPPWKQSESDQLFNSLDFVNSETTRSNTFRCQCVTAAYSWKSEAGGMVAGEFPRCEPLFPELENAPPGTKHPITCTEGEREYFCDPIGSLSCHFTASRVAYDVGNEVVTNLSPWPICKCKRGRGGVRCERRLDVCEDALPLNTTELQQLRNRIPDMPPVLTAKWLCEAYLHGAKCAPDTSSRGGEYAYRCECRQGARADKRFGKLDNCRMHTSNEKLALKKSTLCPPGYAGDNCDMTINPWSDWGQWSECRPVCGSHRRRTRRRICLGDFGCYGSIYDAERCPPVECNGLRDPGDGVWSARSAASIKEYKDNGGFFVPATIEILVTTLFCVFICQVVMNRDMQPNNFGAPNILGNGTFPVGRPQLIPRASFIPNPNTNPPRIPAGVIPYSNFVLTVPRAPPTPRIRSSQSRSREARFKPRQIISAKEFAFFAMSLVKSPIACSALQFLQLRRVDAETAILKAVNEELCSQDLLGIYSESPFYRPVLLLRDVQFATPTSTVGQLPDPDNMLRQLKDLAEQKVASVSLMGMMAGTKPTAASLGFCTDYLMHTFNVELDLNLIAFLNEQAKLGNATGDRYRVILRFGWATQGLCVPTNPQVSPNIRLLAAESLPRCLQLRVARRQVPLPEPIFHAGQAVKLGHRLRYSVDITDKIPVRAANLIRSRNVEIEMTWLHTPLEDHPHCLLESVGTGALSPAMNHVINMPLVQVTLDRIETLPKIVRNFSLAVAGRPTDELTAQPQQPPAVNGFSLPPFTPERLIGVYDFCASSERVISVEKTLDMLKKKMASQDDLLCDDWIPVTLLCPLTLTRIEIPIRSVNCDHLQCFDLFSYLSINKRRPRWNCPVCSLPSPFRDLRRDDFFLHLLKNKSLADAEHVKVDAEGNCRKVLTDSTASVTSGNGESNSHKPHRNGDSSGDGGSCEAPSSLSPFKTDPCSRQRGPHLQSAPSSASPSQRRRPPSPCILIIDDSDSDDKEEEGEGEEGEKVEKAKAKEGNTTAAPNSLATQQAQSMPSTLPTIPAFAPATPSSTPSLVLPMPISSQAFSGDLVVDLTEISDDSDDEPPPPKSSRVTAPAPSPPPPPSLPPLSASASPPPVPAPPSGVPVQPPPPSPAVVAAAGAAASPPSLPSSTVTAATVASRPPILVIPTETPTSSVTTISAQTNVTATTAAAISHPPASVSSELQTRLFAPLTAVSGSRILFLSNPQPMSSSNVSPSSNATVVTRTVVTTATTMTIPSAAVTVTSVTPSGNAKRSLITSTTAALSGGTQESGVSAARSGRFKITAKRRCVLSSSTSNSTDGSALPASSVVIISPPLVSTTSNPPTTVVTTVAGRHSAPPSTPLTTTVLSLSVPAHRLRSSRQTTQLPPTPSKFAAGRGRGRGRRRVFIDDGASDLATPSVGMGSIGGGGGFEPSLSSTSTGAVSEEAVEDEVNDDEEDEEEGEEEDDDDDDDWTPGASSSNTTPNSARRRSAVTTSTPRRRPLNSSGVDGSRSRRG